MDTQKSKIKLGNETLCDINKTKSKVMSIEKVIKVFRDIFDYCNCFVVVSM